MFYFLNSVFAIVTIGISAANIAKNIETSAIFGNFFLKNIIFLSFFAINACLFKYFVYICIIITTT